MLAEARGASLALSVAALIGAGLGHAPPNYVGEQTLLVNFAAHLAGAAAVLGALSAALGAKWRGLAVAALALTSAAWLWAGVRTAPVERMSAARAETIRIVSFNILKTNLNGARIAHMLAKLDLDVAVIVEAEALAGYFSALDTVFPHRFGCDEAGCDVVILSKHPLSAAYVEGPEGRLRAATISPAGAPVRIYAAHWRRLFFSKLRSAEYGGLRRLVLQEAPKRFVLAGDFNTAPWAPEMGYLTRPLKARFADSAPGTWPVWAGRFGLPVDHIMISQGLAFEAFSPTPSALGSNHRGLLAEIRMRR